MNRLSLIRYTSAVALGLSTLWSAAVCAAEVAGTFDKIQQIRAGDLNIGYVDIGPRDGQPVILLHGWPYDIQSYAQVALALAQKGYRVIVPYLRGYGTTRFLSASTPRNGQPSAMAADIVHSELCPGGAGSSAEGLPGDRAVSSRLRHDPFPLRQHAA
nr:alpha/beta fold hydrolase [Klebsiella pneumoniae]